MVSNVARSCLDSKDNFDEHLSTRASTCRDIFCLMLIPINSIKPSFSKIPTQTFSLWSWSKKKSPTFQPSSHSLLRYVLSSSFTLSSWLAPFLTPVSNSFGLSALGLSCPSMSSFLLCSGLPCPASSTTYMCTCRNVWCFMYVVMLRNDFTFKCTHAHMSSSTTLLPS